MDGKEHKKTLLGKGTFVIADTVEPVENTNDLKILIRFAKNQPLLENMEIDKIEKYIYENFLMILDLLATDEMIDLFLEKLSESQRDILYSKEAVEWHDLLP